MVPARMIRRIVALSFVLLAGLFVTAGPAAAHPHVWVTMTSEVVYAPDGSATGFRQAWTFDDMYSTFATQDITPKVQGQFSREELEPLAKVNIDSLKEYDYFTYGKANDQKLTFAAPVDYWLEYKDSMLVLHFTLPFAQPVRAARLSLEVFDPEYFVDFSFAEKNPVALSGAPEECKLKVVKPEEASAPNVQRLPDAMASQPDTMNYGAQFANRVLVECPGMPVSLARHGEIAQPGRAYLAPDGCQTSLGSDFRIACTSEPAEHGLRPSVSFLFRTVARRFPMRWAAWGATSTRFPASTPTRARASRRCISTRSCSTATPSSFLPARPMIPSNFPAVSAAMS